MSSTYKYISTIYNYITRTFLMHGEQLNDTIKLYNENGNVIDYKDYEEAY